MNLEVTDLSFSYGARQVLNKVSFKAVPGDLIAVLGPNGVGKSTLFKCILGFLKEYQGTIAMGGEDIVMLSQKDRAHRSAYIPQSSSQVFDFTVVELVMMGMTSHLSLFGVPQKHHEEKALNVLEELGISHLAHQGTSRISGGEYQLVLLARALVQEAKLLIMDEPTANLDYGNQYRVMDKIAALSDRDFMVILSTHDPNQALLHANRVLVMNKGAICQDGTPEEVMTDAVLSDMYGISVARKCVDADGHKVLVCVPTGIKEAS